MTCPICKKSVAFDDPEMPFCSERCRLVDLGNWASEKYVIAVPLESNELEDLSAVPPEDPPGKKGGE